MKHTLYATVSATVTFTEEEWHLIVKAFKRHYDFNIRTAAELGGWLYGFEGRFSFEKYKDNEANLTFRQIDTILKSLEMNTMPDGLAISFYLVDVLKEINNKGSEINNDLS